MSTKFPSRPESVTDALPSGVLKRIVGGAHADDKQGIDSDTAVGLTAGADEPGHGAVPPGPPSAVPAPAEVTSSHQDGVDKKAADPQAPVERQDQQAPEQSVEAQEYAAKLRDQIAKYMETLQALDQLTENVQDIRGADDLVAKYSREPHNFGFKDLDASQGDAHADGQPSIDSDTAIPPDRPEIRQHTGGAGPLLAAADAWTKLAAELETAALEHKAIMDRLTNGGWAGPASTGMADAVAPYVNWLATTAKQAEKTAEQMSAIVQSFEAEFAKTVPPEMVAKNREQLAELVKQESWKGLPDFSDLPDYWSIDPKTLLK